MADSAVHRMIKFEYAKTLNTTLTDYQRAVDHNETGTVIQSFVLYLSLIYE